MALQPTASKTKLLLVCQRPFDPEVDTREETTPEQDEKRDYGTNFHLQMQRLGEGLPTDHEHAKQTWEIVREWLETEKVVAWGCETPLAYNPKKDRARPTTLDLPTHTYDLKPGEIGATYDLLTVGGKKIVVDYKTGDWGSFDLPAEEPQLMTLGLATKSDVAAIVHAPRGLPPVVYSQPFDRKKLESHRKRLVRALNRVGDHSLTPGAHCTRCPAKWSCPAKDASLLRSTKALVPAANLQLAKVDDPGHVHLMLAEYERLAKRARELLRERVRAGEHIERPDGKVLQFVSKSYSTLSQSSIRRALPPEKAEEVIRMLRESGCIEEGEREELWAK